MPAIARGDEHCVYVLAAENFTEIAIQLAVLILVMRINELFPRIPAARLDVGNSHASQVRQLQH